MNLQHHIDESEYQALLAQKRAEQRLAANHWHHPDCRDPDHIECDKCRDDGFDRKAVSAEIKSRLNDGESICIGATSYTLGEILSEGLVSAPDLRLWADSVALDTEAARKAFRARAYEIVEDWVKAHIDDIAMVEYGVAA